jgi:hypothetical protein
VEEVNLLRHVMRWPNLIAKKKTNGVPKQWSKL